MVAYRVVVADDVDDIRFLLRLELESMGDFEVVGEAATGAAAVVAKDMTPRYLTEKIASLLAA